MSETQNIDAAKPEQQMPEPLEPVQQKPEPKNKPFNLALLVALGALALSGWQLYSTQLQLDAASQALSRHGDDPAIKSLNDQLRASDAKLALLEARFTETSGQFASINGMYQDLTKVSSDWLLSEVGHTVALSSQELQLAGNVPNAIAALQAVNDRLASFDRPELLGVKTALAHDLEKLKAVPNLDTIGLSAKIDSLTQTIDGLPLAVDIQRQPLSNRVQPPSNSVWEQLLRDVSSSLGEMVRIRRIDKPEAVLLTPEQSFMLRENIKLRLLDARIALLQRNAAPYTADITAVQVYVQRYFDATSPATKQWLAELAELKAAPINSTLPDLSESLKAINSAQATTPVGG